MGKIFILSLTLAVFVLLFLFLVKVFTANQEGEVITFSNESAGVQASPSASLKPASPVFDVASRGEPSPTPTPLPIPRHSGRQVKVPILTYHYIGSNPNPDDKTRYNLQVTPDKFEEQMNYLATNGYNPITLDTLYTALKGGSLPPKPVVLTFDDGYIDFYHNAYPILSRFNFKAVVFIPTKLVGGDYYMNWDQIKEIDSSNLVSFQSHSVNHVNLVGLTQDRLKYETSESKRILEEQLNKKVNFFAYPYGLSDESTWQAAKEAGYLGGVGTWYGKDESEGNVLDMPRIKIFGEMDITTFASRL